MHTYLAEMGHPQPSTPLATDKIAENSIVNRTEKQKYRAIDMKFYRVHDITRNKYFHIFW